MPTPEALARIAEDVHAGKPRRAKVRSLLGYYGLRRRGHAGIAAIEADLEALRLETTPHFADADLDQQVRFLPAGSGSTVEEPEPRDAAVPRDFEFAPAGSIAGRAHYRLLLRTYDAYERLRERIVRERLATVLQAGQNARREDRNEFPFVITVELPASAPTVTLEEAVAAEAEAGAAPEPQEEDGEPQPTPPLLAEGAVQEALYDYISDAGDGVVSEILGAVREVENRLTERLELLRLEAVRQLAREQNNEEALELLQDLEREKLQQLREKEGQLLAARREINLLEERLSQLESQVLDSTYDPGDAYPTMADTVRLFQDLCTGAPIRVHENALRSAARSGCTRRREVLQFLLTLRELACVLYRDRTLSGPLDGWFQRRGYDYAHGDSEATRTRYGAEREILLDSRVVQLAEHVTLFPNGSNCVSIYFHRQDAENCLVVGYVGPHLRTARR